MADFDKDGRVLGVILGGIAAGLTGTPEIEQAMARELVERRALDAHRRASDEELIARRHADLTADVARDVHLLLDSYHSLRMERGGGLYEWERTAIEAIKGLIKEHP